MTQRTRNIISNVSFGVGMLFVVAFVAQHFMPPPHPAWHEDVGWLGFIFLSASGFVRGRLRRRTMQT